jgi:nitroreductase
MSIDLAAADELLSTTRSVRRRLDLTRAVPRQVIVDCVRLAQQAPTASNRQGWSWIIVDDAEKRAGLAALYRGAAGTYFEEARTAAASAGAHQNERVYDSAQYLANHFHEVPIHVIPCIEGRPYPGRETSYFGSIYPAVWSFQLALRARGLGSVLTTLHLFKEAEAAKLLGIPEGFTQCGLLPVAYTIGTDFKPASRPDPESIIHWNAW